MVREFNPLSESITPLGNHGDIPWEKTTGREIYELDSITGLNKTPVKVLGSFILGGHSLDPSDDPPFTAVDLVKYLLIDGTIVIQTIETPTGKEHIFLHGVMFATKSKFIQAIPDFTKDGKRLHRIWTIEGDRWMWQDVTGFGTDKETVIDSTDTGIAADNMFVFPNDKGILYDAQFTYRRLEEIERKVRKASNSAVSLILTGYTGMLAQLYTALAETGNDDSGILVVPQGTGFDFPKTTAVVDQLHKDFIMLLPGYFKQTNLVEFDDSSNMSGKSRKLLMQQTLEFTRLSRNQIEDIYNHWSITVTFDSLPTLDADEKMKELNFLKVLKEDGVLNITEYKRRALKLL